MMYNEEQKQKFINGQTKESSKELALRFFTMMQDVEEEHGKDVAVFDDNEMQTLFEGRFGMRKSSKKVAISLVQRYIRWCKENGLEARGNEVLTVDIDNTTGLREKMVASPIDLKRVLDDYFDEAKYQTADVVLRTFLWLAFIGVEDRDSIRIKCQDVDVVNLGLRYKGEIYELPRESREDFLAARNLEFFNRMVMDHTRVMPSRGNKTTDVHINNHTIQREPGDLLLRMTVPITSDTLVKTMRPRVNFAFRKRNAELIESGKKSLCRYLSYNRVWLSGVYYRVFEQERAGCGTNFTEIAVGIVKKKRAEEITERGKESEQIGLSEYSKQISYTQLQLEEDYRRWKQAFLV